MNDVVDVASYLYYKRIAWGIDAAILAFYFVIVICILLQRKNSGEKKITTAFLIAILINSIMVGCNIVSWYCFSRPETRNIYEVVATISLFLTTVMFVIISQTVNLTISHKVTYNNGFFMFMHILMELTGLTVFIPSFRHKLFIITENSIMVTSGWFVSFFLLSFTYMLICCIYGFMKIKQIGTRDSLVIFFFCLMPFSAAFMTGWYRTVVAYLLTALALLVFYNVSYQSRLQTLAEEKSKQEVELVNIQKTLLLNQIKPHFIYNSLSTIKYLCETDPEKASDLCDSFSSFLRSNIDSIDNEGLIDIDKEMENVENYLKIEQARFGERIKYLFNIDCHDFCVPVLSIETIVENAVKHGICQRKEGGTIVVSTFEDKEYYYVRLSDDGIGFDIENVTNDESNHAGIQNTIKRFKIELDAEVKIESEPGKGTMVTIAIPKED